MKGKYLKRYWDGVDVTIVSDHIDRVERTNTISDRYGDADLVYDPGHNLPHEEGVMQVVLSLRNENVYTIKTGCKCGEYDILDPRVVHHFIKRIDAMVEIAAKMGASTICTDRIDEIDDHLIKKLRDVGVSIMHPDTYIDAQKLNVDNYDADQDAGYCDPDLV